MTSLINARGPFTPLGVSRSPEPVADAAAISAAHNADVPVVVDGAAQSFRVREIIDASADLLIVSGQKYLGSPTAGLVMGHADLVSGVVAQDKSIGRGMKASKEALAGVIAANELMLELVPLQPPEIDVLLERLIEILG